MAFSTIFKDLKVVELASVLAGPAVGVFFAELGATVIKIENKTTGGDVTRSWKTAKEDPASDYSAYYCSVNWGKQTLLLDLQNEADQVMVHNLIAQADIVISNFRKHSAEKMRMDYDFLKKLNPRLIFGQISGFGEDDDTPAFDVVLQAEAGFLYMTGEPDRAPVKMPVALIDILTAHQLKEAILIALLNRQTSGKGAYVAASLFESAVASLANQATNWLMAGQVPQRMGTQHPNIAPYGDIFATKDDSQVVLAVGTERQFLKLCEVLNLNALPADARFSNNTNRVQNRKALAVALQPAFLQFDRDALLKALRAAGVPAAAIRSMPEVFDLPLAQKMVLEANLPNGQASRCVRTVAFSYSSESKNSSTLL